MLKRWFPVAFVTAVAYGQGVWSPLAPLPAPREGAAIGHVGKTIVSAYGYSFGDTTSTLLYHIQTNVWSPGPVAPGFPRAEMAYGDASHEGFVYVAGGRPTGTVGKKLQRYHPATNTWATLADMPTARAAAAIVALDDALYVIGGRTGDGGPCSGGPLSAVERYDIETGTWSKVAPLPGPARSDLAAVAHGGKIYVFGGCTGIFSGFLTRVDIYHPVTNTWSSGTAMPTARASLVAAKVGNRVYLIGGYAGGGPLAVNEVYNITKNSWSADTPIPLGRGESNAVSSGCRIYVVGGSLPAFGASIADVEVFKPARCAEGDEGEDDHEDDH